VVLVVVLVAAAVLIGGLTRVGPQSGPFDASINRSFAAQVGVLAQESNATGSSLRGLMRTMAQADRPTLEAHLDDVVAQATDQAARAATLADGGGIQRQFVEVLANREKAVTQVRLAVDGLLGMEPLSVVRAPGAERSGTKSPTLLSSTQTTDRIAAAGRLLAGADRNYRQLRHTLVRLAGHAVLPVSRWITGGNLWQIGSVAAQVDLVAASTTLEATHKLVLSVVTVTPPALPSPTGVATPGVSMLSPTTTVTVNVVLSNEGSVDEPHASVKFALAPASSGAGTTATGVANRTLSVAARRSVSLSPVSFQVKPGASYQLSVVVAVPPGQAELAGTSVGQVLQIAPST
jgi:hypothetical protein